MHLGLRGLELHTHVVQSPGYLSQFIASMDLQRVLQVASSHPPGLLDLEIEPVEVDRVAIARAALANLPTDERLHVLTDEAAALGYRLVQISAAGSSISRPSIGATWPGYALLAAREFDEPAALI